MAETGGLKDKERRRTRRQQNQTAISDRRLVKKNPKKTKPSLKEGLSHHCSTVHIASLTLSTLCWLCLSNSRQHNWSDRTTAWDFQYPRYIFLQPILKKFPSILLCESCKLCHHLNKLNLQKKITFKKTLTG